MIAWFARNHVAANLLMVSLLLLGLGSLKLNIPLEVFPTIEPRVITVNVSVPGTLPRDIETSVSIKLEEAVQDLEGIEQLSSRSSESLSQLTIQVDERYDPQTLLAEVKNRIDAINNLPAEAERPIVSLAKRTREVISVAVSGPLSERELRQAAERLKEALLAHPDITQVSLDAVRDYEITLTVDPATLERYQLNLETIAAAINRHSRDISAGSLKTEGGEILLKSSGQAYSESDFQEIVILSDARSGIVRLGELARIDDGFIETPVLTRFNGQPAALVDVFRVGQESAIEVAEAVREVIATHASDASSLVQFTPWRDRSKIVKKRLKTLSDNALQGGIMVLCLLTLFLRPAIAFWVCIGIPVSFMGAFLAMPAFGITLNVISLFGFIVILGIVVDDAIVTGENIYSHLRRSDNSLDAVINGTKEVAVPVTFGILTTVAAFLPIAFIEGVRGQLFAAIPVVVIPILLFSLIESKLVLPSHLKHLKLHHEQNPGVFARWQQRFANGFEQGVLRYYQPALQWALRQRYLCLATAVGTLIILYALLTTGWMRFIFFPKVQSEVARASLVMPTGTPFELTDRYVQHMLKAAQDLQDKHRETLGDHEPDAPSVIVNILATTGSGGESHVGRVMFEITPPEERQTAVTSSELVAEWRRRVGQIPGAESLTYRAEIGRVSDPIDIQLSGEDFTQLQQVADAIKRKLATYPTVFDIEDSFSDGKDTLEIRLKRQAEQWGLSRSEIVGQVRQAFYGLEVQRVQRGREDIKVMLRFPLSARRSVASLEQYKITTDDGRRIPLGELVELLPDSSPVSIQRIDRFRTLNVRADIDKQATNMLVLQEELRSFIDQTLQQYPDIRYTMEGEAKEQRQSFGSLKWGLLFVLFIIYALLAIPFKSYSQPLIVMLVIPFGGIGAVLGHWLMGMDLTLISLLGMLALIGIVVNDSLVLVDFVNRRREQGGALLETISIAAAARFRPVILTSLTTFLGLMPLLFEKSTQAQFLIPMAVSLGFGILFATVITLVLVPINYLVIEDVKGLVARLRLRLSHG
ncbi:MAG: efflux RND transporter permease subunit [Oleiphilaceae bacterium]|nr:efflux RND transporter permease subunit [Oleiphilaceae bacterium]